MVKEYFLVYGKNETPLKTYDIFEIHERAKQDSSGMGRVYGSHVVKLAEYLLNVCKDKCVTVDLSSSPEIGFKVVYNNREFNFTVGKGKDDNLYLMNEKMLKKDLAIVNEWICQSI